MPRQIRIPFGAGASRGLSAARGIIEAEGGATKAASRKGAGAACRIYPPTAGPGKDNAQSSRGSVESNRLKILVIDDDRLLAELFCRMLEKVGFAAAVTTDPEAALGRVRKNPEEFDVIITDQVMPKQSGLELAAAIREVRLDLPVILLTGNENFGATGGVICDEVSLCLSKPIDMQTLAEAVREVTAALSYPERSGCPGY